MLFSKRARMLHNFALETMQVCKVMVVIVVSF